MEITNFLLFSVLTDYQLKLLELIQYLHERAKSAQHGINGNAEPIITLQYTYITALLNCSPSTITAALDKLYALGLIDGVTAFRGECNTYRYNPDAYTALIEKAKKRTCTLISGRQKQRREVPAQEILNYMTGKAAVKARKRK